MVNTKRMQRIACLAVGVVFVGGAALGAAGNALATEDIGAHTQGVTALVIPTPTPLPAPPKPKPTTPPMQTR